MKECGNLIHTCAELIKIINYNNSFVLWTIDYEKTLDFISHNNVSICRTQNYYVAINCFYTYISIPFLSEVYNMAKNLWIGFFTATLAYVSF